MDEIQEIRAEAMKNSRDEAHSLVEEVVIHIRTGKYPFDLKNPPQERGLSVDGRST